MDKALRTNQHAMIQSHAIVQLWYRFCPGKKTIGYSNIRPMDFCSWRLHVRIITVQSCLNLVPRRFWIIPLKWCDLACRQDQPAAMDHSVTEHVLNSANAMPELMLEPCMCRHLSSICWCWLGRFHFEYFTCCYPRKSPIFPITTLSGKLFKRNPIWQETLLGTKKVVVFFFLFPQTWVANYLLQKMSEAGKCKIMTQLSWMPPTLTGVRLGGRDCFPLGCRAYSFSWSGRCPNICCDVAFMSLLDSNGFFFDTASSTTPTVWGSSAPPSLIQSRHRAFRKLSRIIHQVYEPNQE